MKRFTLLRRVGGSGALAMFTDTVRQICTASASPTA
jgi:hypothetical protein